MTKVVILCGGKGTRLREETEYKPKPLVEIGGRPIVWHIMKHYAYFGFTDFVLCLGYKGEMIKQYFLNYKTKMNDFTIGLKDGSVDVHGTEGEDWNVTCVDTGQEALTGERLLRIAPFIGDDPYFMVTYGDGVSDVNISELFAYHKKHGKIGTLSGIKPLSKYGALRIDEQNSIQTFVEKPQLNDRINGGFIVFSNKVFAHLDTHMFENTTLPKLAEKNQLQMFLHDGFWHCMDTYRDYLHLNKLWEDSQPWKTWHDDANATLPSFSDSSRVIRKSMEATESKRQDALGQVEKTDRILIIGASGFLGTLLYNDFQKDYDQVVGTYCTHPEKEMIHLDITNKAQVEEVLTTFNPTIVIQPAAQPWVDFCEENPEESRRINVAGAQHVIDWCAAQGVYYLFLSSDYIFDGVEGPYLEGAHPNPLNVYGQHKLAVEQYVAQKHSNKSSIVRTVGVYGWEKAGKNFVARLIKTLADGKEIVVPGDQYGTPVHAADLSAAIRSLVAMRKVGTYHAAGPQNLSRYDFSLLIADVFGCDKSLIKGVSSEELRQKANRPRKAGLISTKIQQELTISFRSPQEALTLMRQQGNPYQENPIKG
jgi:glucose-1-phosphate cytidylyltransferase